MPQSDRFREAEFFELFDIGLLTRTGLQAWIAHTLERCAGWFGASGGSVFLMDDDGAIRLKAKAGSQEGLRADARIEIGHGIAGTVLLEGKPRIIGDPSDDPVLSGRGAVRNDAIASSMVVPLLGFSDERVGVLNLSRSAGEPAFQDRDLKLAVRLGAFVALAVGNAKLVSLLKDSLDAQNYKVEQLEAVLGSVSGKVYVINGANDVATSEISPKSVREAVGRLMASGGRGSERAYDDASDRTWILDAVPLSQGGSVVTVQDVSDFQRAQVETARLRRLAEIGQMTAAIAHEIRNPLTGIRGAAQLIGLDASFAQDYAKVIEDEADKLNRLCEDFLEISRPLKLEFVETSLKDVVRRVVDLWTPEFEQSKVKLTLDSGADEPTIPMDVRRIEQVLHNLVRNALQACSGKGEVQVQIRGGVVTVCDDGTGMDGETVAKLFAPFFTTKAGGTGLGLCNVRRIVDAHGGSVNVRSEPGKGTRFEISLRKSAA
ncbi:MAG: GAF domain-containing protein [Armatimonadetes bacterium]|nr:GAF domain-containing protein [Armatimonadota bacterium]